MRFELILLALLTFICLSCAETVEMAGAAEMTDTSETAEMAGPAEMTTMIEATEMRGVAKTVETIALSAIEDVYLNFVEGKIYNTDILRCEMDPLNKTWPVTPLIKFDLSGIDVTDDAIGILVLKADSVQTGAGEGPGTIALFPTESNWTDKSDFATLSFALAPLIDALDTGDLDYAKTSVRFDNDDDIFAFEVSKHLKNKTSEDISFILVAVNDDLNYRADFLSTESGYGPHLLITAYPISNIR